MNFETATTSSTVKNPLLDRGLVLNGKWEILQHIATGGKGEVYRARQINLNRDVVVKTLSVGYLAEFGDDQEEVNTEIQRLHREALAMARVRHPYVVQVYDQDAASIMKDGEEITVQYVVMEYVPGARTLRNTMPYKGFKDDERDLRQWIRTYFLPMFDGLETVHVLGIVHRDMKPENVLLDGSTPKIVDFGIAGGPVWSELTKSHHVEGTITYMAPEQFMDLGETDARADVYALGKMLYEAVQGKMVDSKTACPLKGVCLSNPATSFLKELDLIIQQTTAEDMEQRIPSVASFREVLEGLLEKADASERPLLKGLHRGQQILILIIILFFIGLVVASNIFHHYYMLHGEAAMIRSIEHKSGHGLATKKGGGSAAPVEGKTFPPDKLLSKDGSTMHLVPRGQVQFPKYVGSEAGKPIKVASFYMDETEVTNYEYVEFLNQTLSKIKVKAGVVRGDRHPWLVLGPVYGGYEPIIFRDGRFLLQDSAAASRAVVKVTAYGASAYAKFYGKRLPTETEWLLAAMHTRKPSPSHSTPSGDLAGGTYNLEKEVEGRVGTNREQNAAPKDSPQRSVPGLPENGAQLDSSGNEGAAHVPYSVFAFKQNMDGIRGLMRNVSEWSVRLWQSTDAKPQYVVAGGIRGTVLQGATPLPGLAQEPSTAFEDVGFRCAKSVKEKQK
jgi:eukaryotic-like serine/threonine-protein kinase